MTWRMRGVSTRIAGKSDRDIHVQCLLLHLDLDTHAIQHRLYDIDQARSLGFDGERAALNPRDVEQIVDQRIHLDDRSLNQPD